MGEKRNEEVNSMVECADLRLGRVGCALPSMVAEVGSGYRFEARGFDSRLFFDNTHGVYLSVHSSCTCVLGVPFT